MALKKSWLGNLLKGIATAIGTVIGGPVGGILAAQAFESIDSLFFNNSLTESAGWFTDANGQFVNPFASNEPDGLKRQDYDLTILPDWNGGTIDQQQADNLSEQELENWYQTKVLPKFASFFSGLNPTNELQQNYADALNKILLRLEAHKAFYEGNAPQLRYAAKGDINFQIDDMLQDVELKSKTQIIGVIIQMLKNAYEQNLKNNGVGVFTKTLKNFKAHLYNLQGKQFENLNFSFAVENLDVPLYVLNKIDDVAVNYNDGTTGITDNNSLEIPNTPTVNESANTTDWKNIGKTIKYLVGGTMAVFILKLIFKN